MSLGEAGRIPSPYFVFLGKRPAMLFHALLLFLSLSLSLCLFSQPIRFSKTYDLETKGPPYNSDRGKIILLEDNGYTLALGPLCEHNSRNCIALLRIDSLGEEMWQKTYKPYPNWLRSSGRPRGFIKTSDGHYLITGDRNDPLKDRNDVFLMKLNSSGDTLWTSTLQGVGRTWGREIYELPNGNYLMLVDGYLSEEEYAPVDLSFLQVDTSGNLLWQQELGTVDSLYWRNFSGQMDLDQEGKMLIVYQSVPWSIATPYTNRLSRVDLEGNVLWTRSVSHTACGYYVKALPEGGSIIYGCKELPAPPAYIQPFIARLNDSGHELWTRFFALPLRFIYGMDLTPDGHLLMAGNYLADAGDVAWIAKYSVDGDSIWSRTYLMEGIPYVNYFFQDVKATADGGLIATGMLVDTMPGGHINPNTWVLKLDENGCFSDDCQQDITITTATREVTLRPFDQEDWFLLSPNPAVWELNLRLLRALPSRNGRLEMYDTSGRLVSDAYLDGNSFQPITFPVSALPSGIYFMVLKDERGRVLQTKSWVKE